MDQNRKTLWAAKKRHLRTPVQRKNVMNMKGDAEGRPLPKQSRVDAEADSRMMIREVQGAKFSEQTVDKKRKKKTKSKNKPINTKSFREALGERVERFGLLTSIAQAPARMTLGQLVRDDTDDLKFEFRKILSERIRSTELQINTSTVPHRQ